MVKVFLTLIAIFPAGPSAMPIQIFDNLKQCEAQGNRYILQKPPRVVVSDFKCTEFFVNEVDFDVNNFKADKKI